MKIVANGRENAGGGVTAPWRSSGREVTGPGPGGGDRGPRDGSPAGKWWTLAAVCLGTFMLLLDISIVFVALPGIQKSLGASPAGLRWIVDAYALSLAALLLTVGSLSDLFGRRLSYAIGLVVFTGSSLWCGLSSSTLELRLARGVQGVGGAIMFSVSLALLAEAFRGRDRGIAFAAWGGVIGVAVAIGPLLGGALVSGLSWRWIFCANLPVGAAAVIITLMRVAESRASNARRPDLIATFPDPGILAGLLADAKASACQSAPAPPPRGQTRRPDGLTAREAEVLGLLTRGHTNLEIAAALVVSVHTVERHLANAYRKVGVRNRAAAAAYMARGGI